VPPRLGGAEPVGVAVRALDPELEARTGGPKGEHPCRDAVADAVRRLEEATDRQDTTGDRFHHDLAVPVPPLAGLQRARELSSLDSSSDGFRFASAALLRERNRVVHALEAAAGIMDAFAL